jgi:hypothetical protein
MGGGKGPGRILVGTLVGVALVAAVGVASRAHTPGGGGHTRSISHDVFVEYLLLLLIGLAVVLVPLTVYLIVAGHDGERTLPERKNWMLPLLLFVIGVSVAEVLVVRYLHDHHGPHGNPASSLLGIARHGARASRVVGFDWGPVIVVSSLTFVALVALVWLLREQRRTEPSRTQAAAELAALLERTIADLRAEPDPRKAVIAAYAQMEHALAGVGLARRAEEAPREYLGRVLPDVGAQTESVERLTRLFERAKFSPHTIDAAMKDEAIDALESLRDDLRSTP